MGLKNYTQQLNVINKSDTSIQNLKDYANSMSKMITNIDAAWTGSSDKTAFINLIKECVKEAESIILLYSIFSLNAKRWLKEMNELDKITKGMAMVTPVSISIPSIRNIVTGKRHIKISELEEYAALISGYGKKLDSACNNTKSIQATLDRLILQRFDSKYSMGKLNQRVLTLQTKNSQVAAKLKQVCTLYRDTEDTLKTSVTEIYGGGSSSGIVSVEVSRIISVIDVGNKPIPMSIWKMTDSAGNKIQKNNAIEKFKESETGKVIQKYIEKALGISTVDEKIDKYKETIEKLKNGEYWDVVEPWLKKSAGKVYDAKTGEINTTSLKLQLLVKEFDILINDNKYIQRDVETEIGAWYRYKAGHVIGGTYSLARWVENVMVFASDVTYQVTKDTIKSVPIVSDVVSLMDAAVTDLTGKSVTESIDKFVKNQIDLSYESASQVQKNIDKLETKFYKECKTAKKYITQVVDKIKSVYISDSGGYTGGGAGGGSGSSW
jgi:hypothetical protein